MRLLLLLLALLPLMAHATDHPPHARRWYARHLAKRQKQHQRRTEHRANKVNRSHF